MSEAFFELTRHLPLVFKRRIECWSSRKEDENGRHCKEKRNQEGFHQELLSRIFMDESQKTAVGDYRSSAF
jgi:hypothetical protein